MTAKKEERTQNICNNNNKPQKRDFSARSIIPLKQVGLKSLFEELEWVLNKFLIRTLSICYLSQVAIVRHAPFQAVN